jgi:mono/diheme cytochrome c family protein
MLGALAAAGAVWTLQAPPAAAVPATAPGGAGGAAPKGFKLGGDPAKGRQVYASSCALCHGDAGDGRGEAAGVLSPRPSNLTDAARLGKLSDWDLYRVIRDGGPALGLSAGMQGFKPLLPDAEVRNVASFVRTLAKGRRPPKP